MAKGDPFQQMVNFWAGAADALTLGYSAVIRQQTNMQDTVQTSSFMYFAGQFTGTLILSGILGNAGIAGKVIMAGMGGATAIQQFEQGDIVGGVLSLGATLMMAGSLSRGGLCGLIGRPAATAVKGVTATAGVLVEAPGLPADHQRELYSGL